MCCAEDFWSRLAPHLLAAGLVQHLDPETLLRTESEKAKVQATGPQGAKRSFRGWRNLPCWICGLMIGLYYTDYTYVYYYIMIYYDNFCTVGIVLTGWCG